MTEVPHSSWTSQSPCPAIFIPWRVIELEEEQKEKVQSQNPACKSKQPSVLHLMQRAATLPWAGSVLKIYVRRDVKSKKTLKSQKNEKQKNFKSTKMNIQKSYPSVVLYVKTKQLEITNQVIARVSVTSV